MSKAIADILCRVQISMIAETTVRTREDMTLTYYNDLVCGILRQSSTWLKPVAPLSRFGGKTDFVGSVMYLMDTMG